jgi:site-specific recombinase XerD
MHLDEAVERFLTHLSATRAPHTVKAYGTDLAQFAEYAIGTGIEQVQHLNERLVRSWLDSFRAASRRTRERKLYCLRAFFKYCRTMGWIDHDPSAGVALPVQKRPLPRLLTQAQAEQLMQTPEPDYDPLRLRDRAAAGRNGRAR